VAGAASGAQVRDIDSEIDCILALAAERNVFQHPAWLRAWLREFGDRFDPVFLACDSEPPLAVAPLMRDDFRLTFIGHPSICDFMDLTFDASRSETAVSALWERIRDEDWAELDLWGIPEPSPTRALLPALAAAAGYEVEEQREAVSPRLALPDTWDAYLESLPKKDRHELRRKLRRLFDSGARVDLEVLESQDEVNAGMDAFLRLHTISRQDKAEFMSGQMPVFFRVMASALSREGLVRLFMLNVDGKAAASVLCFDAGSALYMYNSGYDPEFSALSVGLLSKALCIKWAIENGKQCLDFLRGNEPYKYDLGARDRYIFRVLVRRS
jgi:CelD/BcsL family acetyltransferase involved in cellulose biosynthesis